MKRTSMWGTLGMSLFLVLSTEAAEKKLGELITVTLETIPDLRTTVQGRTPTMPIPPVGLLAPRKAGPDDPEAIRSTPPDVTPYATNQNPLYPATSRDLNRLGLTNDNDLIY